MARSLTWRGCAAVLAFAASCQQPTEPGPSLRRLRVRAPASAVALPALDRDTQTRLTLSAPATFTLHLSGGTRLRELKLHSPTALEVSVLGHSSRHAEVSGWTTVSLDAPLEGSAVTITLTPRAAEGSLGELELWGEGLTSVAEEPPGILPGSNLVVAQARYGSATLTPKSTEDGNACDRFEFSHDVLLSDVRRAWLTWDAEGVAHVEALKVSLNDAPLREGLWLDGAGSHPMLEELDSRNLAGLTETAHLCLPDTATRPVTVSEVRLLLAVDDGAHWVDRDTSRRFPKAFDGDEKTSEALLTGEAPLALMRTVGLERVGIGFQSALPGLELEVGESGARQHLSFPTQPALTLKKTSVSLTKEVSVSGEGVLRAGLPLANATEVLFLGSPEGKQLEGHHLTVAHPQTQRLERDGVLHVGHYDGVALVAGWATSEAGVGRVTLDDAVISSSTGAFSVVVRRPALLPESEAWRSTLRASFPDGVTKEVTLSFDVELKDTVGTQGVTVAPDSVLFGAENQTAAALIGPAGGNVTLGERISFSAPPGALAVPTRISITRGLPEVVPKLDPGMVNVTAPANAGYRFGPAGQRFAVPVRVTIPYDARLLPEGMSVTQVETWYFDEAAERWERLPRKDILHATQQVVSETTHFTFMINAVLVTPEHAEPANFNPTSLKDLKAASPLEGLDLIEVGDPGSGGSARLSMPIRLPKARGEYQPQLALTYDSSQGNGLLGVGWSLPLSSITLETRFGVPDDVAAPRYLLDGAQLVPTSLQGPCRGGGTGLLLYRRTEADFSRIVRCGSDDTDWNFEVTTKTGLTLVYGGTADSRLTSYLSRARIAEWHLSEVVDRNGNRSTFSYDGERRQSGDALNREDFVALYPRYLRYAAETGGSTFPFMVEFKLETDGAGGLAARPDVMTSARYGFKTLTRRRLGAIVVSSTAGPEVIREYVLHYEQGDFDKSRLQRIELYGKGGKAAGRLFTSHTLEYDSHEGEGFGLQEWEVPSDDDRLGAATEWSLNLNHFGGVSMGFTKGSGSIGTRIGWSHREARTTASFLDLNGDRIPDRLTEGVVFFGDKTGRRFRSEGPPGDPSDGVPLNAFVGSTRLPGLGTEYGNSLSLGVEAEYAPIQGIRVSAATGGSLTFTDSEQYLSDADGDGLIDFVSGSSVFFNEPRGSGQPCASNQLCFTPTKTLRVLNYAGDGGREVVAAFAQDGGGDLSGDAERAAARARVESEFSPNDPLVEWISPFAGTIDVTGALVFRHSQAPVAGRDGVRLQVALRDAGTLVEVSKAWGDASPTQVEATGLAVRAGQHLYFRLSTGRDLPVAASDAGDVPLEEVHFSPTIRYRCPQSNPDCQSIRDGAGDLLYVYDLAADFRLAGRPPFVVQAARTGKMRITWSVVKPAMLDQVRLCALSYAPTTRDVGGNSCQEDFPRADDGVIAAGLAATAQAPFIRTALFEVTAGTQFAFKAETRMAIDVRGLAVSVHGEMTELCEGTSCRAPTADEARYLQFDVPAQIPAHSDTSVVEGTPEPFEGVVMPADGELVINSEAPVWACTPIACAEIAYSIRTADRVLMVHGQGRGTSPLQVHNLRAPVRANERVFAEAHSETALKALGVGLDWVLSAGLARPLPDGGVVQTPIDLRPRRTWENTASFFDMTRVRLDRTVLSGGYHGWHFGVWGGRMSEPLDFDLLEDQHVGYTPPTGTPEEQREQLAARARDPESWERRRARMLGVMLPREQGTAQSMRLSNGAMQRVPGLKPDVAAFVSTDLTAWVASDATWHASKKGGYAAGPAGSRTVDAAIAIGDLRRSSFNETVSQSLGVQLGVSLSGTASAGISEQSLEALDLNGDGIMDVVDRGGARLTDRHTLGPGERIEEPPVLADGGLSPLLRTSHDLSLSVGLGTSINYKKTSTKGDERSQSAAVAASVGGGVALNLGVSRGELMDINGDGLPDHVKRDGTNFEVRLNLGNGFGEPDLLPVGTWSRNDGTAGFITGVALNDAGVAATTEALLELGKTQSILELLGTQEQVRRTVAATLSANAGFVIENSGVSANLDTSLSGTEVALLDVTGDGLPDYIRRNPNRTPGPSFLVKVNLGDHFSGERVLPAPSWPDAGGPNFIVPSPFGATGLSDAVRDVADGLLGLGGDGLLEANGGATRVPSLGFHVTIPIEIFPTPAFLLVGFGLDYSPERVSGFELGFMDMDGDGMADQVLKTDRLENPGNAATRERIFVRRNNMGAGNLLKRVNRPLGGSLSLTYQRLGNTVDLPEGRYAVSSVISDDGTGQPGPGHRLRTDWAFTNGRYERSEREFLGFEYARATAGDGTSITRHFDVSGFERKGLLLSEEVRDSGGQLFTSTRNTYHPIEAVAAPAQDCLSSTPFFLDGVTWCTPGFIGLESTEKHQFEGTSTAKVSRQTYAYDDVGNVEGFIDEGDADPAAPDDDLNATVEYLPGGSRYLVGLPRKIVVRAGQTATGAVLRGREALYDPDGNLTHLFAWLDGAGSARAETTLDWNPNGTLAMVTSPPNATGDRYFIKYEMYDPYTKTWPTRISDAFTYVSTASYAPEFDQPLSTTDINNQTTTRTLDEFGRVTSVTGPREQAAGNPTITIKYQGAVAVTSNLLPDGAGQTRQLNVSTFVDGLGRVRQTKTTARVETRGIGMTASGAQEFDALGRVTAQGQPVFTYTTPTMLADVPMVNPTRFAFDALGRTTSTTEANGAVTSIEFRIEAPPGETLPRLATQTKDARGKARHAYRDAGGRVVAITEEVKGRKPTTRYAYAPTGELLSIIDAAGNPTSMTYDVLGRRLSLSNPDTGTHTSTFDAAGNLTTKVTPRLRAVGRAVEYVYEFNRLAGITYPFSEDVTYTYGGPGAPNGGAGRVIEVVDDVGVEKREFGALGEVTKQTRTVRPLRPGDRAQEYELGFEWDSFGRALRVKYPDGEVLQYLYDEGGLLKRAIGTRGGETEVYLADVGYDEFGQRVRAEYGNGVVTTYTHEPETRRLETLTSRLSPVTGGTKFQDLKYGYDAVGNVESLTNRLASPVATPFGGRVEYVYGYDDLNRLTSATGKATTRPGVEDTFKAGWEYSDIHNLERATLVREVTSMTGTERPPGETRDEAYLYEAAHPHRARSIGTLQLDYDGDGNTIRECEGATCAPGRASTFAWDEEGRMEEATAKGRLVRFRYDADGQRMVKLAAGGPSFTFGQWWTMSGNSHATKHIFAGAGRVATKMLPAATTQGNTPPPGTGWPNTNGCIPSGDQPQKCPTNSNGTTWVERGVARPATWYYHSDSLGSTQWLTDDEGKLHERVEYYPYGEVWRQSSGQGVNKLKQAFLYTGKEYDSETGLTYFGARYYDSRHARWLTPDPAAMSGNVNSLALSIYSYGFGSPVMYLDPDGLYPVIFFRRDADQIVLDLVNRIKEDHPDALLVSYRSITELPQEFEGSGDPQITSLFWVAHGYVDAAMNPIGIDVAVAPGKNIALQQSDLEVPAIQKLLSAVGAAMVPGASVTVVACGQGGPSVGEDYLRTLGSILLPQGGTITAFRNSIGLVDNSFRRLADGGPGKDYAERPSASFNAKRLEDLYYRSVRIHPPVIESKDKQKEEGQ